MCINLQNLTSLFAVFLQLLSRKRRMTMLQHKRFDGFWTMLATPFGTGGEFDTAALNKLIDHQVACGVTGLLALGSTGEFYALDDRERAEVLSRVISQVAGRMRTIAGANAGSTSAVTEHAKRAKSLGYESILLAPPYYSLPRQDDLERHFLEVADRADIDIILYDNAGQAGVNIAVPTVERLADHPRIVGIKEVSGSMPRIFELLERVGSRLQIINGLDDLALDLMFWGVNCWMSGPGNFLPRQLVNIHKSALHGHWDEARSGLRKVLPLIRQIESGKYLAKIKYGCHLAGLDVGEPRGPMYPLNDSEKAAMRGAYRAITEEALNV
jgi:4-hydroxy-tetrahydrodipicolinate synthase